jgi:hypothetical protein
MRKEIAIKKNLDLLNEFMKYAFENPEVIEEIPPDAELIILPIDDQELFKYNKAMGKKIMSQGRDVVFVKMRKPEISPPEFESTSANL